MSQPSLRELHRSTPFVLVLFLLFAVIWLFFLHGRALVPSDEGRYAEMGREMFATGDWITLRLNGLKYFEKPPLQTWMNALTFSIFGLGEWQARLWTGLCGLFGVAAIGLTGARVFTPRTGLFASLVLGSSFFWVGLGHVNTLDMGLSAMMLISLCGLLLAQRDEATVTQQRDWMLVCWAGMALAVLSKGLIGIVLPGAILVLYTVFARDWAIWKRLHLAKGLMVFFVITTPWFVLISARNPEFLWFFFVHEHFQRFTSEVHHRAGPIYYFIPLLIVGIIPWLGALFQSLWQGCCEDSLEPGFRPKKMLVVWAAFIFFFFSISDSKLPSYILPIFPAIALLIGCYLDESKSIFGLRLSAVIVAVLALVTLALRNQILLFATHRAYSVPLVAAHIPWIIAAVTLMLAGAVASFIWSRNRRDWAVLALAFPAFIGAQLLLYGSKAQGDYKAGVALVEAVDAELTPETPIFAVGSYEQSLPFYLQRTTTLVDVRDELDFGLTQQPDLWIPNIELFAERWNADRAAGRKDVAIINYDRYQRLRAMHLPMRIIAHDALRIIAVNLGAPNPEVLPEKPETDDHP